MTTNIDQFSRLQDALNEISLATGIAADAVADLPVTPETEKGIDRAIFMLRLIDARLRDMSRLEEELRGTAPSH